MAQLKKPTIKNPALVSAMAEFKAKQNPQTEKEMLDAIAEASFIAPIALQKQLDEVEPDENGQRQMQASLMAVSNKDGSKFFPAFTDWLEFLKWKNDPEADTMVITFDQYCGILLKQGVDINGIVINPSETNIVIRKEKMAEMKGVSVPTDAPKNHRIMPLFGTEKITNSEVIIAADRLRPGEQRGRKEQSVQRNAQGSFCRSGSDGDAEGSQGWREDQCPGGIHYAEPRRRKVHAAVHQSAGAAEVDRRTGLQGSSMSMANYTAMLSDPKSTAAGIVIDRSPWVWHSARTGAEHPAPSGTA